MNSAADVWKRVLEILSASLSPTTIDSWFKDSKAVDMTEDLFVFSIPTEFNRDVINSRFLGKIKEALFEIFSGDYEVLVLCDSEVDSYLHSSTSTGDYDSDVGYFTFEHFVVGASNRFAAAAARAVSENPGIVYNPLFIYGDSGLGKTHLLYAIRNAVSKTHPDYKIVYIKGDDFTNELINAIQTGKNNEFREKYRSANLLLVDDVQFIAGKIQTQEEFFHTFNSLYETNHQIVLTSDRQPSEILRLEDRLKTRFEWGLLADIAPPDYETRVAIVKNKAKQLGLMLPDEISSFIAENVTSNVRQLEGVVNKIMAYRDLLEDEVNIDTATKVIKDFIRDKSSYLPTADAIISECASYYSVTAEDLLGPSKKNSFTLPRQIAMYLIRKLTNFTLENIGQKFNRDHSTVLSSIRKIENNMKSSDFANTIRDITANINSKN